MGWKCVNCEHFNHDSFVRCDLCAFERDESVRIRTKVEKSAESASAPPPKVKAKSKPAPEPAGFRRPIFSKGPKKRAERIAPVSAPIPAKGSGKGPIRTELAVTSLSLGLASLFCLGILSAPFAIGYGIVAINKANVSPGDFGGKGMAAGGILSGALGGLVSLIWIIPLIIGYLPGLGGRSVESNSIANSAYDTNIPANNNYASSSPIPTPTITPRPTPTPSISIAGTWHGTFSSHAAKLEVSTVQANSFFGVVIKNREYRCCILTLILFLLDKDAKGKKTGSHVRYSPKI